MALLLLGWNASPAGAEPADARANSAPTAEAYDDLHARLQILETQVAQLRDSGVCYVPTLTREVSTFVYGERPDFFPYPHEFRFPED